MGKVLVVVDMQKKFIVDCGAFDIVPLVADKIKAKKAEGYEIVLTLDKSGGKLCGEVAAVSSGAKIYKKHSYGCKQLILALADNKPEIIEFAGVCTDICVITNVLGVMAFLPESKIIVDAKCCSSNTRGHLAALQVMKACKIEVI